MTLLMSCFYFFVFLPWVKLLFFMCRYYGANNIRGQWCESGAVFTAVLWRHSIRLPMCLGPDLHIVICNAFRLLWIDKTGTHFYEIFKFSLQIFPEAPVLPLLRLILDLTRIESQIPFISWQYGRYYSTQSFLYFLPLRSDSHRFFHPPPPQQQDPKNSKSTMPLLFPPLYYPHYHPILYWNSLPCWIPGSD